MGRDTIIEADKQAASARSEIARMAEEATARAASMITELTQSLKAEAERSISEIRQSMAESHGLTSMLGEIASVQESSSEQQEDCDTLGAEDQDSLPE